MRRDRELASDRSVVQISLTSGGLEKIEGAPGLLQEEFVARFRRLEPWERKMLTSAVERIASLMDAEEVDAAPILQAGEILPKQFRTAFSVNAPARASLR